QNAFPQAAILLFTRLRQFERKADNALHSLSRVQIFLDSNLVKRPLLENSTKVAVHAFRILTNNDEINILGLDCFKRAKRRVEQTDGAHVRVQIHPEPHSQQNFFGVNVIGDAGIAKRTDQNGVKVSRQLDKSIRWNGGAVAQVSVSSPVESSQFDRCTGRLNHVDSLGDDLFSNPIPGYDSNPFVRTHGRVK